MNQKSVNRFIESAQFIESTFIAKQSIQVNLDQLRSFQSTETKKLVNIVMIKVAVYWTLVKNKKIKIFFLIISEINKALSSGWRFRETEWNDLCHVIKWTEEEAFDSLSRLSECFW